MSNAFVHVELETEDVPSAKKFYNALFAWELEDTRAADGQPYTLIKPGSGTGGGIMKNPMPEGGSVWIPYVQVDDINASTKKAQSLGAKLCKDVTEVMGMGWMSIVKDPTGALL